MGECASPEHRSTRVRTSEQCHGIIWAKHDAEGNVGHAFAGSGPRGVQPGVHEGVHHKPLSPEQGQSSQREALPCRSAGAPATKYGRFWRLLAYAQAADQHVWSAASVFVGTVCGDLLTPCVCSIRGVARTRAASTLRFRGRGWVGRSVAYACPVHAHALALLNEPSRSNRFGSTVGAAGTSRMAMSMTHRIPVPRSRHGLR
jgi:hypothetical protein